MAGWSGLRNGSVSDCAGFVQKPQGSICCSGVSDFLKANSFFGGCGESEDRYESKLFDEVLEVFLTTACRGGCIRPVPILLGNDQQPLNLFKLFCFVRSLGGFDLVQGFWKLVAIELGFDTRVSGAIKLIYFKYLYELDRWFGDGCSNGRSKNGVCHCGGDCVILPFELETKFRSLVISAGYGYRPKNHTLVRHKKDKKFVKPAGKSKLSLIEVHNVKKVWNDVDDVHCKDYKRLGDDNDPLILKGLRNELVSGKRKRESLSRMLNWVTQIAKCPEHPSIGKIPPPSKWNDTGGLELWIQAIRARDVLLRKRSVNSNAENSLLQNKKKLCPSMCKDATPVNALSGEELLCGEQIACLEKPHPCLSCSLPSTPRCRSILALKTDNGIKGQAVEPYDILTTNASISSSKDELFLSHVAVGTHFQAEVPPWTGTVSESDTKWLGTQIWPLESGDFNALVNKDVIGKGRPDQCACWFPGSVECIRFHIAERRMKVKLELGAVFFRWRFDQMGEEISLRWTTEEQKRFKDMVRLNPPSLGKCFWDYAHRYFPHKTREELVSYYFNVFLICRRSYQNRVTPIDIDSDDDEKVCGSVSNIYGHEAVKVPGEDVMICWENNQCIDFT